MKKFAACSRKLQKGVLGGPFGRVDWTRPRFSTAGARDGMAAKEARYLAPLIRGGVWFCSVTYMLCGERQHGAWLEGRVVGKGPRVGVPGGRVPARLHRGVTTLDRNTVGLSTLGRDKRARSTLDPWRFGFRIPWVQAGPCSPLSKGPENRARPAGYQP